MESFPIIPEQELCYMRETGRLDPFYLGPIVVGKDVIRIVAYHRMCGNSDGYPSITVLMDDQNFDYWEFITLANRKAHTDEIWESVGALVTSYYWRR